jgi:hypothetical protein
LRILVPREVNLELRNIIATIEQVLIRVTRLSEPTGATSEVLANKRLVSADSQLAKSANKVVVQIFRETNPLEIECEVSRVSTTRAQWVK